MYAKIFAQIFDSSIAENYEVRHVFEDLLKMADRDGVVDMTVEAVSRRANVPVEKIRDGIATLMQPDHKSRSKEHGGARLVPLDSGRDWGWIIVNYQHYRDIQDEESRRSYFRDAKRKERAKPKVIGDNGKVSGRYRANEGRAVKALESGDLEKSEAIAAGEA